MTCRWSPTWTRSTCPTGWATDAVAWASDAGPGRPPRRRPPDRHRGPGHPVRPARRRPGLPGAGASTRRPAPGSTRPGGTARCCCSTRDGRATVAAPGTVVAAGPGAGGAHAAGSFGGFGSDVLVGASRPEPATALAGAAAFARPGALVCARGPRHRPAHQPDRGQGPRGQGARRGARAPARSRAERARPERAGRRRGARPGQGGGGGRRRGAGGARRRRHGPPGRPGGGRDRDPARHHPGRHRERRGPLLRPAAQGPGGRGRRGDQGDHPDRSTSRGAAASTSRRSCAPASTRWSTSGPTG